MQLQSNSFLTEPELLAKRHVCIQLSNRALRMGGKLNEFARRMPRLPFRDVRAMFEGIETAARRIWDVSPNFSSEGKRTVIS